MSPAKRTKVTGAQKAAAATKVAGWRASPDRSASARLAAALFNGKPVSAAAAEEMGVGPAMVSQTVGTLRDAGYTVEREHLGNHQFQYRMTGFDLVGGYDPPGSTPPPEPQPEATPVAREVAGQTHPQLGDTLRVRALVLDDEGELLMQLTNGKRAWTVQVTGHLA